MYSTMRGLLGTLVLLLGALAITGLLASGLQEKATSGHRIDGDFLPGGEAIDRFGWPVEPKAVRSDTTDTGQAGKGADKARSRLDPDDSEDGL